ncbi:MAG: aminotransferase class III-fold pyridoxal phosphate-dependent enzyme [Anaerolineales bacterium]|jgi:taurine--2-oxoglutarate transaminase
MKSRTEKKEGPMRQEEIVASCREHNFWTWSAQGDVHPLPVARAEGACFWDFEGNRYLDFNSGVMCVNIGYGDRRVIDAIVNQAGELVFAGPHTATKVRAELGQRLAAVTPAGLDTFLYTLGGSEANENAIKLARAYTGRHKILTRYRSYHGATHGASAATGDPRRWEWEPNLMPGVVHFIGPTGDPWSSTIAEVDAQTALDELESVIRFEGPQTIAAVLLETIPGTNGVLIPPEGYLRGVREICDRFGIQLICDEVMTGFGRTGAWFAVDHEGVKPDLLTMAKGLTSGYAPLGAVAIASHIVDYFEQRVYQGGLTYNGHPLGLAAAIANIQVLESDQLVERASSMGVILTAGIKELAEAHSIVGAVRSIGMMAALDLVDKHEAGRPLSKYAQRSETILELRDECLRNGLYLRSHQSTLLIMPPLMIDEDDMRAGLEILSTCISRIESRL